MLRVATAYVEGSKPALCARKDVLKGASEESRGMSDARVDSHVEVRASC